MRHRLAAILAAAVLTGSALFLAQAPRSVEVQLKAAQHKEEVEGDLQGAIAIYQALRGPRRSNRRLGGGGAPAHGRSLPEARAMHRLAPSTSASSASSPTRSRAPPRPGGSLASPSADQRRPRRSRPCARLQR